ncbi:MBL fold metallo-hydrolase [Blastococcus sp. SYSU DS0669]
MPGVLQRMNLDRVAHPVPVHFPAGGQPWFERLRPASVFHDVLDVRERPVTGDGPLATGGPGPLEARRLDHPVETYGYRLVEPDGRRMLPDRLARAGIAGADVGRLQRLCDAVWALADGADLLLIESTSLSSDERLARRYGHLTARQAATVAADCGVRTLVLTHFSQRYDDPRRFAEEAGEAFGGEVVVAADLQTVPVPRRIPVTAG